MNNKRICHTFAKYLTDKCIPRMYYPMLLFMCSSVTGWCIEIVYRSVNKGHLYIPGFLFGPYLPIYGFGALIIVYLCWHRNPVIAYLKIVVLSSLLEFAVSFIFETAFDRLLWNYSHLPLSIGSRVNLFFSMVWGGFGVLVMLWGEPMLRRLYQTHKTILSGMAVIGVSVVAIDAIISIAISMFF